MSWITDLIGAGAKLVGRAFGLKPGPDVKPLARPHIYAQPRSAEEWRLGIDRCLYCHRWDTKRTAFTNPPCPRVPPSSVELS